MLLTVPAPHTPKICLAKGFFAARQRWTKALVGVRLSFLEKDLKAQLCRPLHGLEKMLFCDSQNMNFCLLVTIITPDPGSASLRDPSR